MRLNRNKRSSENQDSGFSDDLSSNKSSAGVAHDFQPRHQNPIISIHSWVKPTLRA
ncbi:hypothetical protein HMPREF9418_2313 [Neisseria macacae ATCC 33926]|uniref:Uncharacterized protein n=1 Tax=Neisseria macacae ATCC 33926 TaxID=997348 RepID=A0AA36UIL2_9NEIS|nr:hypothetical protein HMPREF9418_2313 [Neisseria macacae ATCC 33926]